MSVTCTEIWGGACAHLKAKLTKEVYTKWIETIRPVALKDDTLVLAVANDYYVWWLEQNYLPVIRLAATAASGRTLRIELTVSEEAALPAAPASATAAALPAPAAARGARRAPPRPAAALNPNFTFGHFVVGSSNMFAHTASLTVAQAPGKAYNPLMIYGGPSLGKTHLMHAIGHHIAQTGSSSRICYISAEAFLNEYIEHMHQQKWGDFREKYRSMDVLLMDDIQFLAGKDRIQEEFFHTFNTLHNAHRQIVITCDRPPAEVPGLEQRLVSRFEWGVITQIEPPDYETRVAILKKKTERFPAPVPEKVLLTIAERIRTDIRALEGALNSVASYTALHGRPLGEEELENLLRHAMARQANAAPSFDRIQKTVADYYDLRLSDLTGRRRLATIALPRQVAMYLCRSLTPHSFPVIGEAFARNHATVLYACREIEGRMKKDAGFRQAISSLRSRLGAEQEAK